MVKVVSAHSIEQPKLVSIYVNRHPRGVLQGVIIFPGSMDEVQTLIQIRQALPQPRGNRPRTTEAEFRGRRTVLIVNRDGRLNPTRMLELVRNAVAQCGNFIPKVVAPPPPRRR